MRAALIALTAMLAVTACGGTDNIDELPTSPPVQSEAADSIHDYFPILTNTNYHYESPTYNELTQDIYVTYTGGSRIQRRAATDRVSATEVLQYQEGELRLVFGEENFYFFEDLTAVEPVTDMLLLKEPLIQGQKWNLDVTGASEITAFDVSVSTPIGDFQAMEVATEFNDGRRQKEYYVKGIGLVKTVYSTTDDRTIEIDLTDITEQASLLVPVDFFYPMPGTDEGYGKEERMLQINTNSDLPALITEQMKIAGQQGYIWLPGNTVINSIEVDRADNIIVFTLSDNDGINTEEGARALADTLGHFYGVGRVRPAVNGKDFTTGGKIYGPSDFIPVTIEADQAVMH